MAIDTWNKLISLPNAEYKFLVHINPSKHIVCGSDWTLLGSNTYYTDVSEISINAVTDDGVELTERASIALVQANAGSWYFDVYLQRLYVRATDDDDLSSSSTTIYIIMYVWKHFATDNGEYDGFQHKALVRQHSLPNLDLSVDDIVEGIYRFNFGSFTLMNDGWFDTACDEYMFFHRKVLIYIGGEDLPFSEYALYFVGRISDLYVRDEEVSFSVKDVRVGTFSNIPIEKYWLDDHPDMLSSSDGKVKPIFYGEKENIIPVMIERFDSTGFKAKLLDAPTYTDYTTEALSTTENDVPLLPASPQVGDGFYIGHTDHMFGEVEIEIYQQGAGTFTALWSYAYGTGSTWRELKYVDLNDGTSGLTAEVGWQKVKFKIPTSTWSTRSVDGVTAYWIKVELSSFTSMSSQPIATRIRLGNTNHAKFQIAGHIIEDIVSVKRNDKLVASSNYSEDLANGQFTLTGLPFNADSDVIKVHAKGKTVSSVYITKGADIEKDVLKSYLGFLDADLDLPSFTATNVVRTYPLAIYLDTEKSSREILQTIGRSTIAFLSPTEDGKLSFEAYEPTLEEGTLELHDADYYADWKVTLDHKFVKKKVVLKYDRNPETQEWLQVEAENTDVDIKYGTNEILTLETFIKTESDAETVCGGIRDMCSKPIMVVDTSFGMKGFKLFPTRKVVLNRERAVDSTGAFSGKVFRIRTVTKDSSTEQTRIVAMDDLQTLGESFCFDCFTCELCVSAQASCSLCYTCDNCYTTQGGCNNCDTCQLCYTAQGGCQNCDTCQTCDTCQSTVGTCEVCQTCDTCQVCNTCETTVNTCETCQACYTCDDCDTCQSFITCNACDSCQTCNACQVCNTAQDCTVCDVCDTCESSDTCGSCNASCQSCDTCQLCVTTYARCATCQECNTCQVAVTCTSCDSCQQCVNCETCATSENCAGCDVCNTCQVCNVCDQCFACYGICETCEECFVCYSGDV